MGCPVPGSRPPFACNRRRKRGPRSPRHEKLAHRAITRAHPLPDGLYPTTRTPLTMPSKYTARATPSAYRSLEKHAMCPSQVLVRQSSSSGDDQRAPDVVRPCFATFVGEDGGHLGLSDLNNSICTGNGAWEDVARSKATADQIYPIR